MCKIIALSNYKGGVGKTTSCVNIAAALAARNKKVLLIDLDPQFNLTSSLKANNELDTIYEALTISGKLTPLGVKNNLFIVPSKFELIKAEIELSSVFKREFVLSKVIEPLKKHFDFIIIDCPPSMGLLTVNAIIAADFVYTPIAAEFLSLAGFKILNEAVSALGKEISRVFITRFDKRKTLNKNVLDEVNSNLKDRAFKTFIRENVSLAEAPVVGKDIISYKPKSTGALDYISLSKEIIKHTA